MSVLKLGQMLTGGTWPHSGRFGSALPRRPVKSASRKPGRGRDCLRQDSNDRLRGTVVAEEIASTRGKRLCRTRIWFSPRGLRLVAQSPQTDRNRPSVNIRVVGQLSERGYSRPLATLVKPTAVTRDSWAGNEAAWRTLCDAKQRKLGTTALECSPVSTVRKSLRAQYIRGGLAVQSVFHRERHHRPDEAINAIRTDGTINQSIN